MKVIIERASWEYCGSREEQPVEGAVQMDAHKCIWSLQMDYYRFEDCHGLHEVAERDGETWWAAAENEPTRVWVVEVKSIADLVLQVGPCVVYPPNYVYGEDLFAITIYDDHIE